MKCGEWSSAKAAACLMQHPCAVNRDEYLHRLDVCESCDDRVGRFCCQKKLCAIDWCIQLSYFHCEQGGF